ncbi:MAG TPA: penicillin-binding transpeptidase domain-containing protein [Verrucomicrobiae bacterium]|nr:penicillin-binding transpeptidase domain-containing protein [Verrucomicrobiae bacterium]
MLIFDQLKRDDPQLRVVTFVVLGGLSVLLAGLWWVQVVSARDYQESLDNQSYRTVRIPAVRGKILDCNGAVLAENRPAYDVCLYLEELGKPFAAAAQREVATARAQRNHQMAQEVKRLGRKLTKAERKKFVLTTKEKEECRARARFEVASNVVQQVSQRLGEPLTLDPVSFEKHYETKLVLPYPIVSNLDPAKIARFEEQSTSPLGVDLDVQSVRVYPHGTLAAHLIGWLKRDNSSMEGEESFFSYRLPDFRGEVGIEFACDKELRGMAGAESVLVNNVGYRQTENVWSPAEPGHNVVLTLDLAVQQAAEEALRRAPHVNFVNYLPPVRGAVVVMDVRTGDILALASSPTLDPNWFAQGLTTEEWQRISALQAEKNRATYENYMPGSVFKTVVALAALEAGLNPLERIHFDANPAKPTKAYILVHGHPIHDTAPPGDYDLRRAMMLSCNSYFITIGLRLGPERIIRMAEHFHFGEVLGLGTRQDSPGTLPTLQRLTEGWSDRNTANISIGQDPIWVTPLQVAVMTSALANGGRVLKPRLVDHVEPLDPLSGEAPVRFPSGQVRDQLSVNPRNLGWLATAMLADTEDPEGTGKHVRDEFPLSGLRICGKTGTAQVQDVHNNNIGQTTWFASFAPYENPRWAVVVMVEEGASGGTTCSHIAGPIYNALLKREQAAKTVAKGR